MAASIVLSLIFAIISPFVWGLMNVIDKFVVSHKVKNPLSFSVVAGMVNLLLGVLLALFLNWSGIALKAILFPAIAGILTGSQFFSYYLLLKKEDVSNVIGFIYFYPILVAFLSFLFLNEVLSLVSYIGMGLILLGVILLSVRTKKARLGAGLWMIITLILVVALYEFFIKIATTKLPELNGIAINCMFIGLTLIPALLHKNIRKNFIYELRNTKWAFLSESLTFLGIFTLYFAMAGLPATVVSSLSATQPLAVLFIERIFHKYGADISKDTEFLKKLIPILLIVLGIIIIYLREITALIG